MATILIPVTQGDHGYDLNFTLQDSNGNIFDLSNILTLLFRVQLAGIDNLKFSGSMSVVGATAGTCKYTVAVGDFDSATTYDAEIQATFTSGKVVTFTSLVVQATAKIPFQ